MKKHKLLTLVLVLVLGFVSNFLQAQTVYVTSAGKKYHMKNCTSVKEGKTGIDLAEAKKKGLTPCAVCKPDVKKEGATPKEEPKKTKK
jgi:hypothetical protein